MAYLFFKALHIFGFVSWFSGLFYLVRMFAYGAEAKQKPAHLQADWKAQFSLMGIRVFYIIATPALVITWIGGLAMLWINPSVLHQHWIHVKLTLVILPTVYHFYCKKIIKLHSRGTISRSSFFYRLFNEIPSLFLVAVVLLAVVKDLLNFGYLFLGVFLFGVLLFIVASLYKKYRERKY